MGPSPIEEIKSRLDIVDLVQSYIRLQKAGVNFKALCPFHKEKTPSFFVTPARQSWHCFGCSEHGDHFSFVQKIEGIEFIDALWLLAQRTGVELRPQDRAERSERAKLLDICEAAVRFFEKQLEASKQGKEAEQYLSARGMQPATMRQWRLGFAPNTYDSLYQFLRSQGYPSEDIDKAGLTFRVNSQQSMVNGSFKDRFRGRIMFPIFDHHGHPVGFTGRIFGRAEQDGDPKYLNTPQTPVFDKGGILYGFHHAKNNIRTSGAAIIVEGQMDLLLAQQAGSSNAVATSGTALTEKHLNHVKRLADTVVFAFDMDRAGEAAVRRGFSLALEHGLLVKVVRLPQAKDPADLICDNLSLWHSACGEALPAIAYLLERAKVAHDPKTPEGKRAISAAVLPILARMANTIEQAHWVGEVARALGVPDESIFEELKRVKTSPPRAAREEVSSQGRDETRREPSLTRRERLEESLLFLALIDESFKQEIAGLSVAFSDRALPWVSHILEGAQLPADEEPFLQTLRLRGEQEFGHILSSPEALRETCDSVSLQLRALCLKEELGVLVARLESAEREEDQDVIDGILAEITKTSAALHEVKSLNPKF